MSCAIVAQKIKTESMDSNASTASDPNAPSFFKCNERIEEGDTVVVYASYSLLYTVIVKRGLTLAMKYGALRHEFLIGKPWGSKVSATAGYVYALRPSSDLWSRSLPRRTQILYTHDCALILQLLDARPGSVICESGTGSGSLSHAIAMAVAPTGHLYTHDIEETRTRTIEQEFKDHGMSDVTTAVVQNVCTEGFFVSNACDGVFLDVPAPWEAVPHAANAISRTRGGRLVSFSPCIEQVQRSCEAMRAAGFLEIETIEVVPRTYKVVEQRRQTLAEFDATGDQSSVAGWKATGAAGAEKTRKRKTDETPENGEEEVPVQSDMTAIVYPTNQPTHTGYLTHASLLPRE